MTEKKETTDTSKNGACQPKKYEDSRFKKILKQIESLKTELTAKKATDEEIDFAIEIIKKVVEKLRKISPFK